jgi:hypothetical protein
MIYIVENISYCNRFYLKGGYKMNSRAQGTIEYLVIIAIVVVIALVVVGLLLQVMNQGSNIPETSSKTAWKSIEPWGIVDWAQNSTTLTIVLKNNTADTLGFNDFNLTSSDHNATVAANVPAYSTKTITIAKTCTAGTKYSYPKAGIVIDYNSTSISNKKMGGVADIVGTC